MYYSEEAKNKNLLTANQASHEQLCEDLVKILYVALKEPKRNTELLNDFDGILFYSISTYENFINKYKYLLNQVGAWGDEAEKDPRFEQAYQRVKGKMQQPYKVSYHMPTPATILEKNLTSPRRASMSQRRTASGIFPRPAAVSAPTPEPLTCGTFFNRMFNCLKGRPTQPLAAQEQSRANH